MSDEILNPTPEEPVLTERQQFWLDHIQACEASGSSAKQYAEDHDLPVTALYQSKKDLRRRGLLPMPSRKAPSFAKVHMASDDARERVLRICFPSGIRVECPTSSRGAEVEQLLQIVANLS